MLRMLRNKVGLSYRGHFVAEPGNELKEFKPAFFEPLCVPRLEQERWEAVGLKESNTAPQDIYLEAFNVNLSSQN